jgi:mRNA interferase MazF
VVRRSFVPERGDVVWLSFSPHRGRQQDGRRPVLVLSPRRYNDRVGLAVVCPITSRIKGYPFEVEVRDVAPIAGAILVDHVRSVDWRARRAEPAGRTPPDVLDEVVAKLRPLIEG